VPDGDLRRQTDAVAAELAGLAAAMPPPPSAQELAGVPPEGEILERLLQRLDGLLAHSDTTAISLFEEHAAALRAAFGRPAEELARHIENFAFARARETLKTLRQVRERPPSV
jgi:hypothetical protein